MKTTTIKIITLMILSAFSFISFSNTTLAISHSEIRAELNKVEEKRKKYNTTMAIVKSKLTDMNDKVMSEKREWDIISKYNLIISKINVIEKKYQNSTSIYREVTLDMLDNLEEFLKSESERLQESLDERAELYDWLRVGSTQQEKEEIQKEVLEENENDNSLEHWNSEQWANRDTLVANGMSYKEATVMSIRTDITNDDFEFCANFPAEVYTNEAMRKYTHAQWPLAREYKAFVTKYYKNAYTDPIAHKNWARIQQCVSLMYGWYNSMWLTQNDVEKIYKKHYGEYVPYTTPFYEEWVQPEDIEEYIENHHKGL